MRVFPVHTKVLIDFDRTIFLKRCLLKTYYQTYSLVPHTIYSIVNIHGIFICFTKIYELRNKKLFDGDTPFIVCWQNPCLLCVNYDLCRIQVFFIYDVGRCTMTNCANLHRKIKKFKKTWFPFHLPNNGYQLFWITNAA